MPDLNVVIPEGMSKADAEKLFGTFVKQRVDGKRKDKARNATIKTLVLAHQTEYDKLYADALAKG